MRFVSSQGQQVKLVMFEKTELPDSDIKEVDGKKVFIKNGKVTEYTTYTFRDMVGDKYIAVSKNNDYRIHEGKFCIITVDVVHNDFTRKTAVRLISCVPEK